MIQSSPSDTGMNWKLILLLSMFGLAMGLAGTFALSQFLATLLFRVHPHDPLTLAGAVVAILLISPIALYVPLRRATAVDCTVALRED